MLSRLSRSSAALAGVMRAGRRPLRVAALAASAVRYTFTRGFSSKNDSAPRQRKAEEDPSRKVATLAAEGRWAEATSWAAKEVEAAPAGTTARVDAHWLLAKVFASQRRFAEANREMEQVFSTLDGIFQRNAGMPTFWQYLAHLGNAEAILRNQELDEAEFLNRLDVLFQKLQSVRARLLEKDPSLAPKLEDAAVYMFYSNLAAAYLDARAFDKVRALVDKSLLFDLPASAPQPREGAAEYDVRQLRWATGLNFLGLADYSNRGHACSHDHGHGAGHHHHHGPTDAEAAAAARKHWERALEYTRVFESVIRARKPLPIGASNQGAVIPFDHNDQFFLRATTTIRDNLVSVLMTEQTQVDEALRYAKENESLVAVVFPPMHRDLLAAQAQYLALLLEARQMDEAEQMCEKMLAGFPRTAPIAAPNPHIEVLKQLPVAGTGLQASNQLFQIATLMNQWSNPDYAEKFTQASLLALQAGAHWQNLLEAKEAGLPKLDESQPNWAYAEEIASRFQDLGVLQVNAKDFESAAANLLEAKKRFEALASRPAPQQQPFPAPTPQHALLFESLGVAQQFLQKLPEAEASLTMAWDLCKKLLEDEYHRAGSEPPPPGVPTNPPTDPTNNREAQLRAEVTPLHLKLSSIAAAMARCHFARQDYSQALDWSLRALEHKLHVIRPPHRLLLNEYSMIGPLLSTHLNRPKEALEYFRQLVSCAELPSGPNPPNPRHLAHALNYYAAAQYQAGESMLAANTWQRAVEHMQKAKSHPQEYVQMQQGRAQALRTAGQQDEAFALESEIEETLKNAPPQQEQAPAER